MSENTKLRNYFYHKGITMQEGQCKEKVYETGRFGSFHPHQCRRKIWKEGWCRQHHPDKVEKRRVESEKKWKEKMANDPLKLALEKIKELEKENEQLKEKVASLETEIFNLGNYIADPGKAGG